MKKLERLLKWMEDSVENDLTPISSEIYDYGNDLLDEGMEDFEPELLELLDWIEYKVDNDGEPETDEIYAHGKSILDKE